MLAWSEGTDSRASENQKSWLWRHCRRRAIYWLLRSPSPNLSLNPKLKSTGAVLPASFPLVGPPPQATSWKTSPKNRTRNSVQQIKERGALPMIDRGDIRQAIDRCNNIWASLPELVGIDFERHKADGLIAKFKEAGGTVREIDVWAESPRLSLRSGYLHHLVCLSWAVNHYRDNAITYKAQRDKNARELKLANAAITDMQMRQRDVATLDAKYTKS